MKPSLISNLVRASKERHRNGGYGHKPKFDKRLKRNGGGKQTGPTIDLARMAGRVYQLPPGYVPIYRGITDLAAFRAGVAAGRARQSIRGADWYGTPRERESWVDGWIWAQANFPLPKVSA